MKNIVAFIVLLQGYVLTGQQLELIKLPELKKVIDERSEHTKVINFWASWCGPCVKELPYFQALAGMSEVDVILVSVDFPEEFDKAKRLLAKKNIQIPGYLLDEKEFVKQIDARWTGAIPATLIVGNNGQKYFYEKPFTEEELKTLVLDLNSK